MMRSDLLVACLLSPWAPAENVRSMAKENDCSEPEPPPHRRSLLPICSHWLTSGRRHNLRARRPGPANQHRLGERGAASLARNSRVRKRMVTPSPTRLLSASARGDGEGRQGDSLGDTIGTGPRDAASN